MQAIIMAAGKGSRLGNLTKGKPKSFAEINNRKLIEYNLQLLRHFKIYDIIIVVGYRSEAFEELVKDMKGVRLVLNPFYEMVNVLGSFYMGMEFLKEDFVYLHADTLCEPDLFQEMLNKEADIVLPVDYGKSDEEAMKVYSKNGKIIEISKNIPLDIAEGEFIGIASFRHNTIETIKAKTVQLMKEQHFTSYFEGAIQKVIDEEVFNVQTIPTANYFWAEIDFLEDYQKAAANFPDSLNKLWD